MASKYAIVFVCGGDDPRAEFGRMTSTGGSSAGSQLRNRPLTVGLFSCHCERSAAECGNLPPFENGIASAGKLSRNENIPKEIIIDLHR
jgi:hypothetical protein